MSNGEVDFSTTDEQDRHRWDEVKKVNRVNFEPT
jgi:hypothetical protein